MTAAFGWNCEAGMKKAFVLPRWVYLTMSMLTTAESYGGLRQIWLKYKWRDALQIPDSDIIATGVLAVLFAVLAAACWYLWFTYNKRNRS